MKASLDANIVVYAYDDDAPQKNELAASFIESAAVSGDFFLTLQTLAEASNVMRRKRVTIGTIAQRIGRLQNLFPVVPAQADDLDDALGAVGRHQLAFWDAMLWATCRRAGATILFTEDFQDGRTLKGVRFVNPFAAKNAKYLPKV